MYKERGLFSSQFGASEQGTVSSWLHPMADGIAVIGVCARGLLWRDRKAEGGKRTVFLFYHSHLCQELTGIP